MLRQRHPRLLVALVTTLVVTALLGVTGGPVAAATSTKQTATPTTTAPPTTTVAGAAARPGIDDESDVLDRPRRGTDAEARLGGNAATIAARNKMTEEKLRTLLRTDPTFGLDKKGHGFYVEEPLTGAAAAAAGAEPPAAAGPFPYPQTFQLHSKPGASRTIYLDFDGHVLANSVWQANHAVAANFTATGFDIDANPGTFSNAELDIVQSVWQRVSEDYAPFDVDVTTQDPGLAALDRADLNDQVYGARAIITSSTSLWASVCASTCGGYAYIGVSDYVAPQHEYYQPALVFQPGLGGTTATAKNLAEAASHEIGHNFGLNHDGTTSLTYYAGQGPWAPIMGVGYNRPIVQWSKGEYNGANNFEDDFAVMGTHGLAIRADDFGDTLNAATVLAPNSSPVNGIISGWGDIDIFSITASGPGTITVNPAPVSPNLDARIDLFDANGVLIASDDPAATAVTVDVASGLNASVQIPFAGTYYARVDGTFFGTAQATGYSDWASVGQYSISATVAGGPAITAARASVPAGGVVTAVWSGITAPSSTDWIGLYASSATGDGAFLAWRYTTGTAAGNVPFVIPVGTAAGTTYQLRLFTNNTLTRLATGNTFEVTSAPAPTLSVAPTTIARGGIVNATWANMPTPAQGDWIGLYASAAAPDTAYLAFSFTNFGTTGTVPVNVPVGVTPGATYQLRLFSSNGYTRLATSNALTVSAPAAPTLTTTPATIARGGVITATWANIPTPNATDWIGLYATSAAGDGTFLAWRYTNGAASGSGTLSIPISVSAGTTYELRLYSSNTYARLATTTPFTITAPAAPTLTVTPTTIPLGGIITATWAGIPSPSTTDWIGVYTRSTDAHTAYVAYVFTGGTASGSRQITVPVSFGTGTYELRLFSNNTYTQLTASNGFTVTQPSLPGVSASGTPAIGGSVTAIWQNIPTPTSTDWVGLYNSVGDPDEEYIAWAYTGGTAGGSTSIAIPATASPGIYYQLRLFSNNGFTRLASSNNIGLLPNAPCNVFAGGIPVYPAEYASVGAGAAGVRCTNTGFLGYGYIGNWSGETVTFKVFAASTGRMNIRFRYQNAATDATRTLTYNGGSTTLTFHNTHFGDTSGNWATGTWSELIVNVPVVAGQNLISLGGGSGFIDLDEISEARYTGPGLPGTLGGSTAPGTVYQAESSNFSGIQIGVLTTNPGYLGTGYLGNFGYVGNNVRFNTVGSGSGQTVTRTLRFRYRNADTEPVRRLVSVDNSAVAILDFPNTGATWATAAWAEVSVTVSLPENGRVDLEFLGDSGFGYLDLDQMTVAP